MPGFTIYRSVIRLWIFDRSGLYSSEKFNIYRELERFVIVLASYTLITEAELGLNTFIRRNNTRKYIITGDTKLSIKDKPIACSKGIVYRGTMCYQGGRIAPALDYI